MAARSTYSPQDQADWNQADASASSYIRNKPTNLVTQADLANVSGMDATTLANLQAMLDMLPTPRVNRPVVSGDYNLSEDDLGVVLTSENSSCYAPAFNPAQSSITYDIRNNSTGNAFFVAFSGEKISTESGKLNSISIPPDESFRFGRESSSNTWILT